VCVVPGGQVTNFVPSVQVYRNNTASQTALQLPPDDGRTIALLHIITDVTRYTENSVTDTVPSVHVY